MRQDSASGQRDSFALAGTRVPPGARACVHLPLSPLYTQTPLTLPVHVVHGYRPGPVLLVTAAIHGDELNGVEVSRRLLRHPFLNRLGGTLLVVPVVNVSGFLDRTRYLPDRRDLNRCFPGIEKGSMGSRLAWQLSTELLARATHAVDLHTGALHRSNFPQIRVDLGDSAARAMAQAFGAPLVVHSVLGQGTFREVAQGRGVPVITYEAGEALRLGEPEVRAGVRGVLNVLHFLDMIEAPASMPGVGCHLASSSFWLRAERSGLFLPSVAPGAGVDQGQRIGHIADPFGSEQSEIRASRAGILVGRSNLPLVNEGEALYHIAAVEKWQQAAQDLIIFSARLRDATAGDEPSIA